MNLLAFQTTLLSAVQDAEQRLAARIALAFQDADHPRLTAHYRADERFHAASTMKVPVMVEAFRQAQAGRFALTDTLEVNPVFLSLHDGQPFTVRGCEYINSRIGHPEPIRSLIEQMIVVSDDLAANLLITLCGPEAITHTTQTVLGAPQTTVLRCVEDLAAFRAGGMNWTTARDQVAIYHALHTGAPASPAACAEMRAILLRQQINNVIPTLLPPGTPVAHKTGAITALRHDAGTVLAPFATWHLALLSDGLSDPAQGIQTLAELSRLVYDARAELAP